MWQRLSWAKLGHARLGSDPDSAAWRWMPFDLLESIGRLLIPPLSERQLGGDAVKHPRRRPQHRGGRATMMMHAGWGAAEVVGGPLRRCRGAF
eukprot:COSAG01_NODE_4987_length_4568_cov_2.236966_5_plen_93_part_00